ncbi:MAG TPA: hypothetical protein VHF00_08030 [Acidimicrobiales bacterium]|nr:hypothetical protein [Acidimicrobiales bacterium]
MDGDIADPLEGARRHAYALLGDGGRDRRPRPALVAQRRRHHYVVAHRDDGPGQCRQPRRLDPVVVGDEDPQALAVGGRQLISATR